MNVNNVGRVSASASISRNMHPPKLSRRKIEEPFDKEGSLLYSSLQWRDQSTADVVEFSPDGSTDVVARRSRSMAAILAVR